MKAFVVEDGVAVPFDQADVDTDQILPARYLRRPRQGGYGQFLFRDVRFNDDDSERPDFILNQAPYRSATIMVADRNFGCGSSREQAPWGNTPLRPCHSVWGKRASGVCPNRG